MLCTKGLLVISEADVHTKSEPGADRVAAFFDRFFEQQFLVLGEDLSVGTTRSLRLPVLTLSKHS
jgi:hypothetical protein